MQAHLRTDVFQRLHLEVRRPIETAGESGL